MQARRRYFANMPRSRDACNDGARAFDISACADLDAAGYESLAPFQWPWRKGEAASTAPKRFFSDGGFYTPDRRARFIATPFRGSKNQTSAKTPFLLNTGRLRDQWHTMTRTGLAPRLSQHVAEPFVEIHPEDAKRVGLAPADLARVFSAHGAVVLRVLVTERQQRGVLFSPIHWTDQNASAGRVDALVPGAGRSCFRPARIKGRRRGDRTLACRLASALL